MGVFTSSRQYRLGVYLQNPWWLSGASIDLDFDNDRYYDTSLPALTQSLAVVTNYLSCSRASTGYVKTSAGTLTSFDTDTLRITDLGLLVEDARTNLHLASEDFSNVTYWNALSDVTITANVTTSPDGNTTADKITASTNNVFDHYIHGTIGNAGATATHVGSVFFKNAGYNYGQLILSRAFTDVIGVNIDLTTGVTGSIYAIAGSTAGVTVGSELYANGWVRVWLAMSFTSGNSMDLYTGVQNSLSRTQFAGNGTDGVYAWGAQVEQGNFLSSYIPTAGASATRAADAVTISGQAQTLINAATATIVGRIGNTQGAGFAANLVDSNGTNLIGFNSGNNGLASITSTLTTANTANRSMSVDDKLGLAWSGAGRSLCLNGGTVATDAVAQTPSATQKLGGSAGSNYIFAIIERLTIWNSKLADATLQSMTAP